MNIQEYKAMIEETIANLTKEVRRAAERNSHKDIRLNNYGARGINDDGPTPTVTMVKGWECFDLRPKLSEEYSEVIENPSPSEIGDVGWVLAMMLDQIHSKVGMENGSEVKSK